MANPGYVRSTDGNNADNGSTWALANATLAGCTADQSAGDRIWVSQAHAESSATNQSIALPGTLASPNQVLCGNDAAEPPTALASTATVTTTGNNAITVNGVGYVYGIGFFNGSGASVSSLSLAQSGGNDLHFDTCSFQLPNTSGSSRIVMGLQSAGNVVKVRWDNCTVKFAAAGQGLQLNKVDFLWNGGSILSGGTSPTALIAACDDAIRAIIDGVDLSNGSSTLNLVEASANFAGKLVFRNCKLPASWTGNIGTPTQMLSRIELHNCDSGDTNYRLWVEDYAGSVKHETTIVRTGGASDGTTTLAWKMTTGANAEYPMILLESPERAVWNETTGSAVSVTVEIVHDSQGAGTGSAFQDDEIWLEVRYLGTSGFPLGSVIDDAKADVLATAADQSSSSETWTTTGLTTPVKQKLSVSITPQEKGAILWRVVMAKASKTCYVDPKATVA